MDNTLEDNLPPILGLTFDWADVDKKEEKRILRASRYRWEDLHDFLEEENRPGKENSLPLATTRIVKDIDDVATALQVYTNDFDCGESYSSAFLEWVQKSDAIYTLGLMMHVKDYFHQNMADAENTTFIDLFDIEIVIDVLKKMLKVAMDQKIPTANSLDQQLNVVMSSLSTVNSKAWELFFKELTVEL